GRRSGDQTRQQTIDCNTYETTDGIVKLELKCPKTDCPFSTTSQRGLNKHLRARHVRARKTYRCSECGKVFAGEAGLERHQKSHTVPERIYRCDYVGCGKSFATKSRLTLHNACHSAPTYRCDMDGCGATFTSASRVAIHRQRTHQSDYRCERESCAYTTGVQSLLKQHRLRVHSDDRLYACRLSDCGKSFKTANHLQRHQLCKHPDDMPHPWLQCPQTDCPFRTKYEGDLTDHSRAAHSKPYQCPVCGKGFGKAYLLKLHALFAHRASLSMHMKTHTAPDTYRCSWPGCDKSYALKHNLVNHEQTVHKPIIYRCSECGKEFGKEYDLRHHQRVVHEPTHHPELKVRCEWHECDRVFKAR
ncbi:unnamed protein product, partial [Oppiella nova]